MKFEWKEPTGQFSTGERLFVNGVQMGGYFWDSCRPKDGNVGAYKIETRLPGFEMKVKNFSDLDEAKAALEAFTKRWFARFCDCG